MYQNSWPVSDMIMMRLKYTSSRARRHELEVTAEKVGTNTGREGGSTTGKVKRASKKVSVGNLSCLACTTLTYVTEVISIFEGLANVGHRAHRVRRSQRCGNLILF
ncbi:hypothetical protein JVT61DRAFT_7135 [Boletus reticuloceps]|uniref:Uncharacterized protein n=1 Tax=Boletus reticuloceps TaxID=495285 RepID=A0A8I3A774_9AGAM|nr:hypothetical protein JVT61DRAFT_7135 [Boletus reticuloceps]